MIKFFKLLFFGYQRTMWYAAQAKGEYGKIGSFIPETLMIMTYLQVKGISVSWWHIPIYYLILMAVAALIGKLLSLTGVVSYNNRIANKHNDEIMELIAYVRAQRMNQTPIYSGIENPYWNKDGSPTELMKKYEHT